MLCVCRNIAANRTDELQACFMHRLLSACQQCNEQDFLFTPHTVSQVESDFSQIFQNDPVLLRRFGGDLYINWSLTPGGDMPPKWIFRLPKGWKNMLLDKAYFGQSLSQWLIFTAASVLLIMVAT
jgi:hypothetical protein